MSRGELRDDLIFLIGSSVAIVSVILFVFFAASTI